MSEPLPTVLVPGLNCSARLFLPQLPALWRFGPVTIADHTRDDTISGVARRILAEAPPRFALVGLSMGGYIAFEMLRQARERIVKLGLLSTSARADTPEQAQIRRDRIAMVHAGRLEEMLDTNYPLSIHPSRLGDAALRREIMAMAHDSPPAILVRQLNAAMIRADSRADLAAIRVPTLVLVGDSDQITPPERAREMEQGIAGARLVVVPDCGHLSSLERPDAVNDALVALMAA